jgi:hypothetical protein
MQDTVKKTPKVIVAGHVDPELARAVRRLADLGNRSVSREVDAALRRHVMLERFSSEPAGAVTAAVPPPRAGQEGDSP